LIVDASRRGQVTARPGKGFERLEMRDNPVSPPRPYTVRLHFTEPEEVAAGERVFDVKLQGKPVLTDFDVVKEAGGPRRAIVKEFKGVAASKEMVLEMSAKKQPVTDRTAPVLSAIEVLAE